MAFCYSLNLMGLICNPRLRDASDARLSCRSAVVTNVLQKKDGGLRRLGLILSIHLTDGPKQRDLMVFNFARSHGIPVMSTFAGSYAENPDDTVAIHTNAALAAKEVFGPAPA
jgi:hypothetical protein